MIAKSRPCGKYQVSYKAYKYQIAKSRPCGKYRISKYITWKCIYLTDVFYDQLVIL